MDSSFRSTASGRGIVRPGFGKGSPPATWQRFWRRTTLAFVFLSSLCEGAHAAQAAYWPLDEGSGTTVTDASGNSNTGTLTNSPTWTTGKIGNALSFNGTTQYITAGTPSNLANLQSRA